jgi:pimeloyl-ACP methyl ester carboxylesterase
MALFSKSSREHIDVIKSELNYMISRVPTIMNLFTDKELKNPYGKVVNIYHGYGVGNFYFPELIKHLDQQNFLTIAPNLPFWKKIKDISEKEFENIDRRIQRTGERESLIGHSQGGLVATYLGKNYPEHIDKVIALGTPFKGTYAAFINYFVPGCKDMIPNSDFLNELDETPFPDNVDFYSIVSTIEHAVIPYHNALLHEENNNVINFAAPKNIGHSKLITLHESITSLLKFNSNHHKIEDEDYYEK